MTPTFTVLLGSIGRPRLKHLLDSFNRQDRLPGDQIIVTFDSFEQSDDDLRDRRLLVESYGDGFESARFNSGHHYFGIEQVNHQLRGDRITGSHIITTGDDDVLVDHAFKTLRPKCEQFPDQAILYKFLAPWREVLWDQPKMQISRISGQCIAAPRQFVGEIPTHQFWPGTTKPYVEADYHWMEAIIAASGKDPIWFDQILFIARPDQRGDDVAHRGVLQCRSCHRPVYYEDIVGPPGHWCPNCIEKFCRE